MQGQGRVLPEPRASPSCITYPQHVDGSCFHTHTETRTHPILPYPVLVTETVVNTLSPLSILGWTSLHTAPGGREDRCSAKGPHQTGPLTHNPTKLPCTGMVLGLLCQHSLFKHTGVRTLTIWVWARWQGSPKVTRCFMGRRYKAGPRLVSGSSWVHNKHQQTVPREGPQEPSWVASIQGCQDQAHTIASRAEAP